MNPEARLTKKIIEALKERGGWWAKIHVSEFQNAGIPDILGCYRGRFVALEVKLPERRSKLSLRQRIVLARLRNADAYSYVVRSTMDALKVLDRIDRAIDSDGLVGNEPDQDGLSN